MVDDYIAWIARDWPLIGALAFSYLLGAASERTWWRWQRRRAPSRRPAPWLVPPPTPPRGFDHAEQLRIVERATFKRRCLLNRGEARLLKVVEEACAAERNGWRVMAQVSLGEVLSSPDEKAYRAINSKRVDFLLVDRSGAPLHAIELQGSGHHLGPAATRDAIKKEALRRAEIGYIEVFSGDTPAEIRALIAKLSRSSAEVPKVDRRSPWRDHAKN